MAKIVVDASLVAMLAMHEQHSAKAIKLANEWTALDTQILAPSLIIAELTNAFYKCVVRGEITTQQAKQALKLVFELGIEIKEELGLQFRTIELACEFKLPATYDCHYLALAEHHRCELWTGDKRLYNSVNKKLQWVKWIGKY